MLVVWFLCILVLHSDLVDMNAVEALIKALRWTYTPPDPKARKVRFMLFASANNIANALCRFSGLRVMSTVFHLFSCTLPFSVALQPRTIENSATKGAMLHPRRIQSFARWVGA